MHKPTAPALILAAAIAAGAATIALGPLNPPAGPVAETSPSLADIAGLIQASSTSTTQGPWQVAVFDSRDGLNSQNTSIAIADGAPALIHSINVYAIRAHAFDGPGSLNGAGGISTGNAIAEIYESGRDGTNGSRTRASNQVVLDVACPNGLNIAWTYDGNNTYFIHVYYKLLD